MNRDIKLYCYAVISVGLVNAIFGYSRLELVIVTIGAAAVLVIYEKLTTKFGKHK